MIDWLHFWGIEIDTFENLIWVDKSMEGTDGSSILASTVFYNADIRNIVVLLCESKWKSHGTFGYIRNSTRIMEYKLSKYWYLNAQSWKNMGNEVYLISFNINFDIIVMRDKDWYVNVITSWVKSLQQIFNSHFK